MFPTQPAAVFVFIVRNDEHVLLLKHPERSEWSPIGGGVDANETLLDAAFRETAEEVGANVRARFLGVAHAWTYEYDATVGKMIDVAYVMAYEGGEVVPGDDMAGSKFRWWPLDDAPSLHIEIAEGTAWLLARVARVYRTETA